MQIDFSPLTVCNTGTQFQPADNLDFEFKYKNSGLKNINDTDSKNMELGIVDSGRLADFKLIDMKNQ